MRFDPPSSIVAIGIGLVAVLVALLLHAAARFLLQRVVRRERAPALKRALEAAARPSRLAMLPLALLIALPLTPLPLATAAAIAEPAGVALVAALGWMLWRMVGAAFDVAIETTRSAGELDIAARRRRTQLALFRRLSVMAIAAITAGLVLTAIPTVRSLGLSLFASAGVAGIVVGIAARPLVANLLAGVQIALTQPIRIGDAVLIEGEWGHIEEITSTYVVLAIWDERRLVLPLAYFLEKPFQNWTRQSAEIIQPVYIYCDYAVPVERVRAQLRRILDGTRLWDGRVWNLQVSDLKERTIELRALVSAVNSGQAWDLRCHVREQLVAFLAREFPAALPRSRIALDAEPGDGAGEGRGAAAAAGAREPVPVPAAPER